MFKKRLIILWSVIVSLNIIAWIFPWFCDFYTRYITPIWLNTFGRFMGLFPWSMGEFIVLFSVLAAVALIVILILWAIFRKKEKFSRFAKYYTKCTIMYATIFCLVMTLNCTMLYHCTPLSISKAALEREYSIEDIEKVRNHVVEQCNYYSELVARDEDGDVCYDGNIQAEAKAALRDLSYAYPKLKGYYPNVKPLISSSLMSQAYVAGYYFPFSLEANYNDYIYICNLPEVYCHELSHLHGYIYEDEANFLAFRACIESESAFFKYSGYLSVLNYVEREYWSRVNINEALKRNPPFINDLVKRDNIFLKAEMWKKVEEEAVLSTSVVSNVSDTFMEGSLKLNGVEDGMKSYSRVVQLLLQYYSDKL